MKIINNEKKEAKVISFPVLIVIFAFISASCRKFCCSGKKFQKEL